MPRDVGLYLEDMLEAAQRRKLAGMRDFLVHSYFQIDLDIVWDAASNKVPALESPVRRLLDSLDQ